MEKEKQSLVLFTCRNLQLLCAEREGMGDLTTFAGDVAKSTRNMIDLAIGAENIESVARN